MSIIINLFELLYLNVISYLIFVGIPHCVSEQNKFGSCCSGNVNGAEESFFLILSRWKNDGAKINRPRLISKIIPSRQTAILLTSRAVVVLR